MIYLDHSATTPLDPRVLQAMLPWLSDEFGNASSIHAYGRHARVAIEEARAEIAAAIGAHPAELIFTSGGTESNNAILHGCYGVSNLADRLYCGATEHHAVLSPLHQIEREGAQTGVLQVDAHGELPWDSLEVENDERTLVSVMHVNNETGAVHDVKRLRSLLPKVLLHTDAVQSLGKVPFRVDELGVDFATISAHKINGPKGVGAMFIKRGIDFKAYQQGGGQERNRRAGTEPVAQIVGFQHAVRYAMAEFARRTERMATMRLLLLEGVRKEIPDIRINTPENAAPHVLNISFLDAERLDGEAILQLMDIRGVAVSNGSACVSGSLQPSHVLLAMGLPAPEAKAAVRFSVGHQTSEEEVRTAVTILADIVRAMRVETR